MGLLSSLKSKAGFQKSESDCNSESSADDKEIHGFQKSIAPSSRADGARVAQLVRNADLRTAGTLRYSGGNGGRLMIDLHEWENSDKACADGVEAFAVASCILMLKREADRFINNTVAAVV